MTMDPTLKANWTAALRSGKYKQGKDTLRRGDTFCCLGVLADLLGAEWKADPIEGYSCTLEGDDTKLVTTLFTHTQGLGVGDHSEALMRMNDGTGHEGPHTFLQIADYIEENL